MNASLRQYALITLSYWGFTLTDGALRMLVVLYFYELGYGPLAIASLFLFYEFFGVVTNLLGGWVAARIGLAITLLLGLVLQCAALLMLLVEDASLSILWVMIAQALSGVAKDLTKLSAKSGIKALVPEEEDSRLFRWVALLTGSKNALKGAGFFLGGALLHGLGFRGAILALLIGLAVVLAGAMLGINRRLGKATFKPRFNDLFSKSKAINVLSAARLFLFGARDVWFVVALPLYLQIEAQWTGIEVGSLLAIWVIGYGVVQSLAPRFLAEGSPSAGSAVFWGGALSLTSAGVALMVTLDAPLWISVVGGLCVFGVVFAINSAVHSYLIVSYAQLDGASLDVGFYYTANALGRLIGTLLSGAIYQAFGFAACIVVTCAFVVLATLAATRLPGPQRVH